MDLEKSLESGFRWLVRNAPRRTPGIFPRILAPFSNSDVNVVTRKVLDQYRELERLHELTVDEARKVFESSAAGSNRGPTMKAEIDLNLDGVPARAFVPGDLSRRGRAVVYLHGGGFVLGSVDSSAPICRALAQDWGMVVLSVGYSLAPECRYSNQIEETTKAVRYAATDEALWVAVGEASPERLFLVGESAGAT